MKTEFLENGCEIRNQLEELWQTDDLMGETCFKRQLRLLREVPCAIYSGVEVNKVSFCATNPDYVNTSIKIIKESDIAGCVLSWNVLAETVYP